MLFNMSYGSELVSTYFPDVPERCLECPGLIEAAGRLDNLAVLNSANVEVALENGAMEDEQVAALHDVIGARISSESTRSER